jgi:hypothetical protein
MVSGWLRRYDRHVRQYWVVKVFLVNRHLVAQYVFYISALYLYRTSTSDGNVDQDGDPDTE